MNIRPSTRIGIGYLRAPIRRPLTGGWSIVVPGYFYEDEEDEGSVVVYHYDRLKLWGSSLRIEASEGNEGRRFEGLLDVQNAQLVDEFDDEPYRGKTSIEHSADGFAIHGRVASGNSLLILTLNFVDPAVLDEAKRIVRSAAIVDPPQVEDARD
jgi:hypothetical protein